MRTSLRRGLLGLAVTLVLASAAAAEGGAAPEAAAVPQAGDTGAIPAPLEPDPLFDDDFDSGFVRESDPTRRDPLERFNRMMFSFNEGVDWLIWRPATRVYRFAVPAPARRGIHRMFLNANSPSILVNKLFQLKFADAAKVLGRLVLNTTVGWGGLFDPAVEAGWEYQHADFGQTLAYAGVPSGGYLVLPIFGPSSYRDGFGTIADQFFQPTLYFLGPLPHVFVGTGYGFAVRESMADEIRALRESSIDYYAVMRSAYWQHREAELGLTGRAAATEKEAIPENQDSSADPDFSLAILASSDESSPSSPSR